MCIHRLKRVRVCLAAGILTLTCGAGSADEHPNEDDRLQDLFKQQLELKAGLPTAAAEAASDYCVDAPFAAKPAGQVWRKRFSYSGDTFDLTAWRVSCGTANSNVLVRVNLVSSDAFFCGASFAVLQASDQFDVKFTDAPDGSSFCGDLYVSKTFLLEQWSFQNRFNDDAALTLVWDRAPRQRLTIGKYAGQPTGCLRGGIATYSPATGIVNIPSVQLPSGKCFSVNMQRVAPFEGLNFRVRQTHVAP